MKAILFSLALLGGVGCMNFRPIGPLAGMAGPKKGSTPLSGAKDIDPADPVTVAAPRPTPPAMLITPGEVTTDNPSAVTQKLMNEFEYDAKTTSTAPRTAEVSVIKGGVKQ